MVMYGPAPPAGDLTERLVPLRPATTRDAAGGFRVTLTPQTAIWAAVEWQVGHEAMPAVEQVRGQRRIKAVIRPLAGLTLKWRMRYFDLDWDIVSIETVGNSQVIRMTSGVTEEPDP